MGATSGAIAIPRGLPGGWWRLSIGGHLGSFARLHFSSRALFTVHPGPSAFDATEFLERRRFTSPNVTVDAVKIFEDQTTTVRATVQDVTRLGTSRGFESVDVGRARKGADEEITVTLRNTRPTTGECRGGPPFALSVTLPGPVRAASHDAAVLGSRVTWEVPRCEYARQLAVVLRVRYTPPPPA